MSRTVKTQFKYADDTTRLYNFDVDDSLAAAVKMKIMDINDSLEGGTSDGLDSFFVSEGGASMVRISGATIESAEVVPLTIAPNS